MNLATPPDDRVIDLAIIGAGPAGLTAAITASEIGLSAAVFDEQNAPGGQIYRAIENASYRTSLLGEDYAKGLDLAKAVPFQQRTILSEPIRLRHFRRWRSRPARS